MSGQKPWIEELFGVCFYFHGPGAEWHIFHLNRVTKIKSLHCQAISQHVTTIIFFFFVFEGFFYAPFKRRRKKEASPDRQGKVLLYRCGNIYYSHQHSTVHLMILNSQMFHWKLLKCMLSVSWTYFLVLTAIYCRFHILGDGFFNSDHLKNPLLTAHYWRHAYISLLGYPYLLFQWDEDSPWSWSKEELIHVKQTLIGCATFWPKLIPKDEHKCTKITRRSGK